MSTSTLKNIARGVAITIITFVSYGEIAGKTSNTIDQKGISGQTLEALDLSPYYYGDINKEEEIQSDIKPETPTE